MILPIHHVVRRQLNNLNQSPNCFLTLATRRGFIMLEFWYNYDMQKKKKSSKSKVKISAKVKENFERTRNEKGYLISFIGLSLFLILITVGVVTNFGTIRDFFLGIHYSPSEEMVQVRADLNLTSKGARIFNASQPELMDREEFNQKCREAENETAILGCYTDEKIYVYNIVDEELPGIRELATAHELLHAVYSRMSNEDRLKWVEILAKVYMENRETLGVEIDLYPDNEKQEELYVRAGTEIKDLPEELERHYAEIFANQDAVVDFYEGYIAVFRKIEGRLKKLLDEISALREKIDAEMVAYEAGVEDLNAKINEFNTCAKTMNCFTSTYAFNMQRAALVARQQELKAIYDGINALIDQCNVLVNEYNENVLHGQILNMTINSSANVEEVED